MRSASKPLFAILFIAIQSIYITASGQNTPKNASEDLSTKPVYLTLDTGHMEVAPFIAQVLNKHQVKVTFFAANEKTRDGSTSLADDWGIKFWATRGQEGHAFASHTYDHVYWKADVPGTPVRFVVQPSQGSATGQKLTWGSAAYCTEIGKARSRIEALTGQKALPLFRAPGGKTSAQLLAAAKSCGYAHVGWAPAGFLGDELSSEVFSNKRLLTKALRDIRSGDILMAHLGIWSRKDPWAPAVLEPLIVGLKERGFCFATLRQHPQYQSWIHAHGG